MAIRGGASGHVGLATALLLTLGCDQPVGCARAGDVGASASKHPSVSPQAVIPGSVVDCPDGLARCSDGVVEVSRLATIALPCTTPEKSCACPWQTAGTCAVGCAAEGVEMVMDRGLAVTQLCAPAGGSDATLTVPASGPAAPEGCEESQLYRCVGGDVIDCNTHRTLASCRRGCFAEGASVGDEGPVGREAAFAILCSR